MFFFGTNLKMHGTVAEHMAFIQKIAPDIPRDVNAFVIPPYTSLFPLSQGEKPVQICLGAQNMHWADEGAYTGEISPTMLSDLGIGLVMLGHAERRYKFSESDFVIRKKVIAAAKHNLCVLLCVGETAEEKNAGLTEIVLEHQLRVALDGLSSLPKLLVAYEPVWAIGEGSTEAGVDDVTRGMKAVHDTIRRCVKPQSKVPILYGGSVNAQNCTQYAGLELVDGLFVGRAAWTVSGFTTVLQQALSIRNSTKPEHLISGGDLNETAL